MGEGILWFVLAFHKFIGCIAFYYILVLILTLLSMQKQKIFSDDVLKSNMFNNKNYLNV
jgi:hypothetical protein